MEIIRTALLEALKADFNGILAGLEAVRTPDLTGKLPPVQDFLGRRRDKVQKTPNLSLAAKKTGYTPATLDQYLKSFEFEISIVHQGNNPDWLEDIALRYCEAIEIFLRSRPNIGLCSYNRIEEIEPKFFQEGAGLFHLVINAGFKYFRVE